jgi:glucosamine kinase
MHFLLADGGGTKTRWHYQQGKQHKSFTTKGIAPYLIPLADLEQLIAQQVAPKISTQKNLSIYYYGTGCANKENANKVKKALAKSFKEANITVDHDVAAAAKGLCGTEPGIACILGTGSSCAGFNGKKIIQLRAGLGYALGDEGSGAHLGKLVLQHFLYETFDEELQHAFTSKYAVDRNSILESVYRQPFPNKYLASFVPFLVEHKNHYIAQNIIEDGLNEYFFNHLLKMKNIWKWPVHFTGSISFGFKNIIAELCKNYGFQLGNISQQPMAGLVSYHKKISK